jgi:hypothetical protein
MSYSNVGKVWSPSSLEDYLAGIQPPSWIKAVCLHHTAAPSLVQRPKGFQAQHIINMRDFYQSKGWHSGPHFFTDEDQIWGMSPVDEPGVHAVSFNNKSIGIEVLGNYDVEPQDKGRGLECWKTTTDATRIILKWLNLKPSVSTVLFHRDDTKTSKSCPGTRVQKYWVLNMINNADSTKPANALQPEASQYVVAAQYLRDIKGYPEKDIALKLHKDDNNLFFFGNAWLEGAKYDKDAKATVVPISELNSIPKYK